MTAPAYAPEFVPASVLPWRRKPAYRGPLIVIPGGRATGRKVAQSVWQPVVAGRPPAAISRESADAARAFQHRLARLPVRPEISLDLERRSVRVDGVARHLTPREFELLAALAAQPGEPVSRDELLKLGTEGRQLGDGSRTVDVHVAHLRDKLGLPGAIATIRGRGYALNPAFRVEVV
ncbi:MAG: winged helix-turn-helix domain-containing protein [Bifidobacteriaceae bacterium]|jgi:DNA-binding CsgD family transcriptional regulator|nr:winged helix-turn-helix domain-containing protein [Bifidobacteriaceae bacterium]